MPAIRVKNGPQRGTVYEIRDVGLLIGQGEESDIRLYDNKVESLHSRIYRIGEMYFIRNLAHDGYTYVNDGPVTETLLREGDVVKVGSTILVFDSSQATLRAVEESDYILQDFMVGENDEDVMNPSMEVPEGESPLQRDLGWVGQFMRIGVEERSSKLYLEKAVSFIGGKIGCDLTAIVSYDPDANRFKIETHHSKAGSSAKIADAILHYCIKNLKPVLIADAMGDKRFSSQSSVYEQDVHSVICVPMLIMGLPKGCLYLGYDGLNGVFSPEDFQIASIFGLQMGLVMEHLDQTKYRDIVRSAVKAFAKAIDYHDPLMMGHSERVGQISRVVAEYMGLSAVEVNDIYLAGLLHDIGRLGQNDNIVETQRAINHGVIKPIVEHVELGVKILSTIVGLEDIIPMVETHHEFWDGSGLPKGLKGEEIPLGGRIICAANVFDEMLFPIVPEKTPKSISSALVDLKMLAGKKVDDAVVKTLLIAYRKGALNEHVLAGLSTEKAG
ncbi:MAG: HD domain-containing phosphohydrolase [Candidatus Brocadiia bacterium]